MKHAFIDAYANIDSPIHRLGTGFKMLLSVVSLLLIVLTPAAYYGHFILYAVSMIALILFSKVPPSFIFKRLGNIMPFILIVSISSLFRGGFALFLSYTVKSALATSLMIVLYSTMKFTEVLSTLRSIGVPSLITDLFSFMYRYSFLLEDQLLRTLRACESRSFNARKPFFKLKVMSNILGTIFIRTYERAERVYLAMCARGYSNGKSD